MRYLLYIEDEAPSPATKEDIRLLMEQIGAYYDRVESRLAAHEDSIKRHFDVRVEDIRHDLLGASKDRLEAHQDRLNDHGERIERLERHAEPIAAR